MAVFNTMINLNAGPGIEISQYNSTDATISLKQGGLPGEVLLVGENMIPTWSNPFQAIFSHPLTETNIMVSEARDVALEALKRYLMTIKLVEGQE